MDLPQLRLHLRRLLERVADIVQPAFDRDPLLPGRVYTRRFRCGRSSCRCREGEPHAYLSLATWRGGRKDTHSIPESEQQRLRQWTEAYARLREARAEVTRWAQAVIETMDQIEHARTVAPERVPRGTGRSRRSKSTDRKEPQ
jgi:hypothetical protein